MDKENIEALESLSFYCFLGGLVFIFLGIVIMVLLYQDTGFAQIQNGLFIFITGYALVKMSIKMTHIITVEKKKLILTTYEDEQENDGKGY